jgi:Flp pilus assembly protein TadD
LLIVALSAPAIAASRTPMPSLEVNGDDGSVALALESLHVTVIIRGHLARTTFELTYRNALDHDVDGDFTFPLPAGAEVSDLALYFGEHLRHAVAVERVQAKMVYEETVHRRVDPALAEWSASTRAFHFRVYPIPAHGTKVVHIAYDQELTNEPYELDLRYGATLAAFDLTIDGDARVDADGIALTRRGDSWSARTKASKLDGIVHATRSDAEVAYVAYSAADKWWYASAPLHIAATARELAPASHVTLLYDVSASAVQRDDAKLRAFLTAFAARQRTAAIRVVPFHIGVDAPIDTDASSLDRTLATIPAAGATNLAELLDRLPALVASAPADSRLVLVSDGMNTLGDSRRLAAAVARAAAVGRPIIIVNASPAADDHLLGTLASATGGWYIDLTHADVAAAIESVMRKPERVHITTAWPPIRDVLPSSFSSTDDTVVSVTARSREHIVALPLIARDARRELAVRELTTVDEQDLVRRAWARARLRVLLDEGGLPEAVLEHGRTFNQLTPRTSLLVLDSWQDYERFKIPMPAEVREERDAMTAAWAAAERNRVDRKSSEFIQRPGVATRAPEPRANEWFITGTVTDEFTPIPGVIVTLFTGGRDYAVVSNADGKYTIALPASPRAFVLRAELAGFVPVTRAFPHGAMKGQIIDAIVHVASVAESITVTAAAPEIDGAEPQENARPAPSLRRRDDVALSDRLLASLRTDAASPEDATLAPQALAQNLTVVTQVVAKLKSLASTDERFRYYIAARSVLGGQKFFQADAAQALRDDAPELAVRFLTDLAEAYPDDAPTLRLVGRVLEAWGRADLARLLFDRALELAPRETQTWRELLLLDAKEGREQELDALQRRYADYERDSRMSQTDDALAVELARPRGGSDPRRDERAELQVEAMWDSNYTDVDLHVVEPSGEEVFYSHRESAAGGKLHDDVTTGFGPETYTLPHLAPGRYQIVLDYYAADGTRSSLQTLVHVIVYVRGERRDYFVALTGNKETRTVAIVN